MGHNIDRCIVIGPKVSTHCTPYGVINSVNRTMNQFDINYSGLVGVHRVYYTTDNVTETEKRESIAEL